MKFIGCENRVRKQVTKIAVYINNNTLYKIMFHIENHHRLYPCIGTQKWLRAGNYMVQHNLSRAIVSSYTHYKDSEVEYAHIYALITVKDSVRMVIAVVPPDIRAGSNDVMLDYIECNPKNWVHNLLYIPLCDKEI